VLIGQVDLFRWSAEHYGFTGVSARPIR